MSDVTFAVFRSVEDLLEQMDDKNKVILFDKRYLLIKMKKNISMTVEKGLAKIKYLYVGTDWTTRDELCCIHFKR